MVVNSQQSLLSLEVNSTVIAKLFMKVSWPKKAELFHATNIPPEAPIDGKNSKESKSGGQKFFRKAASKLSFLVSCKQIISLLLSTILSLMEFHFLSELSPRTFQFRIFQALFSIIDHQDKRTQVPSVAPQPRLKQDGQRSQIKQKTNRAPGRKRYQFKRTVKNNEQKRGSPGKESEHRRNPVFTKESQHGLRLKAEIKRHK